MKHCIILKVDCGNLNMQTINPKVAIKKVIAEKKSRKKVNGILKNLMQNKQKRETKSRRHKEFDLKHI